MLTLLPKGVCSWDYRACDGRAVIATLEFDWLGEQGQIEFGGATYRVVKHGLMSGRWSLMDSTSVIAEARKPSALFREFEIRMGADTLVLRANSAFTRTYQLSSTAGWSGTLQPAHPFTRRATVDCTPSTPPLVPLFCFWLAALTWRRSAHNSAAHA